MNKKLFVGAAALTTVAIGGYVYYRWVSSKLVSDPDLDELPDDEPMDLETADRKLTETINRIKEDSTDG